MKMRTRKATKTRTKRLEELRRSIDRIDSDLVRLLNRRASDAVRIGREKRAQGIPILDPAREQAILARVARRNRGPLGSAALGAVFVEIMTACRNLQKRAKE